MMVMYATWNYFASRDLRWLILAGLFCGFAIGTKYPGLLFLLLLAAVAVYIAFKRKELLPLLAVVIAGLISAPWFVRNYYYTRNPLFPFFYELLGKVFCYS